MSIATSMQGGEGGCSEKDVTFPMHPGIRGVFYFAMVLTPVFFAGVIVAEFLAACDVIDSAGLIRWWLVSHLVALALFSASTLTISLRETKVERIWRCFGFQIFKDSAHYHRLWLRACSGGGGGDYTGAEDRGFSVTSLLGENEEREQVLVSGLFCWFYHAEKILNQIVDAWILLRERRRINVQGEGMECL